MLRCAGGDALGAACPGAAADRTTIRLLAERPRRRLLLLLPLLLLRVGLLLLRLPRRLGTEALLQILIRRRAIVRPSLLLPRRAAIAHRGAPAGAADAQALQHRIATHDAGGVAVGRLREHARLHRTRLRVHATHSMSQACGQGTRDGRGRTLNSKQRRFEPQPQSPLSTSTLVAAFGSQITSLHEG